MVVIVPDYNMIKLNVNLEIKRGETLALVGDSGSGKSAGQKSDRL